MKIELLYFDGCPNHEALLPRLREILAGAGISTEIDLRRCLWALRNLVGVLQAQPVPAFRALVAVTQPEPPMLVAVLAFTARLDIDSMVLV